MAEVILCDFSGNITNVKTAFTLFSSLFGCLPLERSYHFGRKLSSHMASSSWGLVSQPASTSNLWVNFQMAPATSLKPSQTMPQGAKTNCPCELCPSYKFMRKMNAIIVLRHLNFRVVCYAAATQRLICKCLLRMFTYLNKTLLTVTTLYAL